MNRTVTFRVDEELLKNFKRVCDEEKISYSEMLRLLMKKVAMREDITFRIF